MGSYLFYLGSNIVGLLLAFGLFCWDKYQCYGILNSPIIWDYDYEDGEEGDLKESEVQDKDEEED